MLDLFSMCSQTRTVQRGTGKGCVWISICQLTVAHSCLFSNLCWVSDYCNKVLLGGVLGGFTGLCRVVLSALCCLLQEVSACFVLFVAGIFSYQAYQFCLLCVVCCRKFQLPGLSVLSAVRCLLQKVSACYVLFVAESFSLLCVICCRKFQLPGLSICVVCCRKFQLALCCLLQKVSACSVLFVAESFSLLCVVCCRKFQLALCCLLPEVSACSVLFVAGSFSYQAYRSQLEAMYQDISVNSYIQNGTVNAWFMNYHTWLSQTGNVLSSLFPLLPSPLPPFGAWYELFC